MYSKKTEDLNLHVFNLITGINELTTLTKHISCECKCNFDGIKCNSNQKRNNDKCWCECKNPKKCCVCEKVYIWNPARCCCENGKYLQSIMDDSLIACDKSMQKTKTVPTKTVPRNFNEKR